MNMPLYLQYRKLINKDYKVNYLSRTQAVLMFFNNLLCMTRRDNSCTTCVTFDRMFEMYKCN